MFVLNLLSSSNLSSLIAYKGAHHKVFPHPPEHHHLETAKEQYLKICIHFPSTTRIITITNHDYHHKEVCFNNFVSV